MDLSILLDLQTAISTLALLTPRVMTVFLMVPGFGSHILTGPIRGAITLAVALPAALPTFLAIHDAPIDLLVYAILAMKELVVGLMVGTILAIPLWVVQSIAGILDIQRSPIQTTNNNPGLDQDSSVLGGMLVQAMTVLMIDSGLYIGIIKVVIQSYAFWPAYSLQPHFELIEMVKYIKQISYLFWYVIVYGAPLLIPLILVDFGFATIGIFASGLQVSYASSPIKSILGLFLLFVYWPTFSHYAASDYLSIIKSIHTVFQAGHAS